MNKYFLAFLLLIISLIIIIPKASAVTFDRGETVRIDFQGQNETRVVIGNQVELTGELDGDVYVFAQSLISKAVINGDLLGAVGAGLISGNVNGNIRMLGSEITITSNARNATIAAGTLILGEQSQLNDVLSLAQRSEFRGVTRNIHAQGVNVTLAGTTTERVQLQAQKVFLDPQTSIEGSLGVVSKQKPEQFDSIEIGGTREFQLQKKHAKINPANELVKFFWVLVMVYLIRNITSLKSSILSFIPGPRTLLIPLVGLLLTPIIAILLALTIIGLPLTAVLGLLWVIGLILAKPLFAIFAAEYVSRQKQWNIHLSILITTVAIGLLVNLPFLGSLISLAIFLFGWAIAHHMLMELLKSKNAV